MALGKANISAHCWMVKAVGAFTFLSHNIPEMTCEECMSKLQPPKLEGLFVPEKIDDPQVNLFEVPEHQW